ncbi:MAG: cysteine--tRNA ligase, partial [Pseudomonadota bacterium]|nr:cysteine--tRNA ligase [Pseudomonadota bacterium]
FKYSGKEEISEEEIEALISKRNEARQNKDFETADSIRDDLLSKDIILEDKNDKTFWKKR